jgi:hypothetical protein
MINFLITVEESDGAVECGGVVVGYGKASPPEEDMMRGLLDAVETYFTITRSVSGARFVRRDWNPQKADGLESQ